MSPMWERENIKTYAKTLAHGLELATFACRNHATLDHCKAQQRYRDLAEEDHAGNPPPEFALDR